MSGEEARRVAAKRDCFACKVIGAGGCFAGALYALYQRAQMPATNRNRHFLAALSVGQHSTSPCIFGIAVNNVCGALV